MPRGFPRASSTSCRATWDAAAGDIRKLPGLHSAKFAPDPAPTIATAVEAMTAAAMAVLGKT